MENMLDTLCEVLDEELERQENVLVVCQAQSEAVAAHDIEYLTSVTEALCVLVRDAKEAERRRLEVLRHVVEEYDLPKERQTLSALIAAVPDPWRRRLREFQTALRATVNETRDLLRRNWPSIRRSLRTVSDCLSALEPAESRLHQPYDVRGDAPLGSRREPAFVDQRG